MSNSIPNHKIHSITFLGSFPRVTTTPKIQLPEFAFIGRSNVGKSSLINFLCQRKKLAKTSGTPGKTQMINLFQVNERWILADLPGYGYARRSKKTREKWSKILSDYLIQRENLVTSFVLIDSRIPPQQSDIEKIQWLGKSQIPFSLIFTKADNRRNESIQDNIDLFIQEMNRLYDTPPNHFITSAKSKTGREDVLDYIEYVVSSV